MKCIAPVLAACCLLATAVAASSCQVPASNRQDCGHDGTTQQQCEASGCCWVPDGAGSQTPWCFFPGSYPPPPPPPPMPPAGAPPFSDAEMALIMDYFMANVDINGSGSVVASPDLNTPGGSYYYNWARDAALTMRTVLHFYNGSDLDVKMQRYVQWVQRMQVESDPNNVDVRVDAKFMIPSGQPFNGPWCRPQTDGPGLRAITLVDYANTLIAAGRTSYVLANLFGPAGSTTGAIKVDLAWVVANWLSPGCDLWEELHSSDLFWNRYTMRRALYVASKLATNLGDAATAQTYRTTAQQIEATLGNHYNGQFIFEDVNRQMDSAVICGFNNGYNNDGYLSPTSTQVAGTIAAYSAMFHAAYPINAADDARGVPGILFGRYQGDVYAGGNPWVLSSAALAELFYHAAAEAVRTNAAPAGESLSRWRLALGSAAPALLLPSAKDAHVSVADFATAAVSAGDGVLLRIRYHTAGAGFHMPEQLDKNTGEEASATDLTWSYSCVIRAMAARAAALIAVAEQD